MRSLYYGILISLFALIFVGCSRQVASDEKIAKQYVKEHGYYVDFPLGEVYSYTLDKSKLFGHPESLPFQQAWGVQQAEPDLYFGKKVIIYGFTVSNHPLEKIYHAKSNVYVMLSEGKVIGGYSFPDVEGMVGSCYSVDGKTLEEVTGLSYSEWTEQWKKKYGE
ncbi:hypothetical protein [Paenibacillus wynnii]|uniref:DUF4830 domain-containing protein n=1 Tax=Paenibacillus wynnii TaxID=268407 RepID=A0A098MCM0_9BACL|nr:hypothetical protein [Paenibacillus wynnii]KGE20294.1 hypothetical protein PWYN_13840 [Paenibacillus wynnii]